MLRGLPPLVVALILLALFVASLGFVGAVVMAIDKLIERVLARRRTD